MGELEHIISEIGNLNDKAESSRWDVAEKIATAYAEFKPYERGLTMGLCNRLRKSADTVYGYKHAEELRSRLKVDPVLSVSHFVALHELKERYALTDDSVREWVSHAEDCSMSCRELRQAVSEAHVIDARANWRRKVVRMNRLMTTIMVEAESAGVPNELWQATKTVQSCVSDWTVRVQGWG
jgi:hypothetical protein